MGECTPSIASGGDGADVPLENVAASADGERNYGGGGNQDGNAGKYPGFDRFGRVVKHMWVDGDFEPHATESHPKYPPLVDLEYGYDDASNRTGRLDVLATRAWTHRDHEYDYDGLHRLAEARRGVRDGSFTHSSTQASQKWSLDAIGNWSEFATWSGSSYGDVESRDHTDANEVTGRVLPDTTELAITYDKAGNLRAQEIGDGSVTVTSSRSGRTWPGRRSCGSWTASWRRSAGPSTRRIRSRRRSTARVWRRRALRRTSSAARGENARNS